IPSPNRAQLLSAMVRDARPPCRSEVADARLREIRQLHPPELAQPALLELASTLAGQGHEPAALLERLAALVRPVERAGFFKLPDLAVGEVEFDCAVFPIHIDREVELAGDVRARPLAACAVAGRDRAIRIVDQPQALGGELLGLRESA